MLPLLDELDFDSLHVKSPSNVVFVCGGPCTNFDKENIISLRHAFYCLSDIAPLRNKDIILSEHITRTVDIIASYRDFLTFEKHLAHITELIILFCESPGSIAELGFFSSTREIYEQLLVFIRDTDHEPDSFIKLGPLKFLTETCGPQALFVLHDNVIGITNDKVSSLNLEKFRRTITPAIERRLKKPKSPTSFDSENVGHRIKLLAGLIHDYRALTFKELHQSLRHFGVKAEEREIVRYLRCAESVEWIKLTNSGFEQYWVDSVGTTALEYKLKAGSRYSNQLRRRTDVLDHWRSNDPPRYEFITCVAEQAQL